jgi:hypothetical protein
MESIQMHINLRKLSLGLAVFLGLSQVSMFAAAQNADATKLYHRSLAATCATATAPMAKAFLKQACR